MGATTQSLTMDTLLTMTVNNYYDAGVIQDAVFESNPTVKTMRGNGFRKEISGGAKIQVNLMYGKNDTIRPYAGYEPVDVSPQEGYTPAFYSLKQYPGTVSIDGFSEFQNSGKPALVKMLREKVEQMTMSFAEKLNEDLWDLEGLTLATGTTNTNGKAINSIPLLVQKGSDTVTSVIGEIDQATNAHWRNRYLQSSATSFKAFTQEWRHNANSCGRGSGGSPDLHITDQETFELYEAGMDDKTRYQSSEDATIGFENISFKGGKLFWDINVPDVESVANGTGSVAGLTKGSIFSLNSKYMNLCIGKGKDFAPLGFQRPANQDARTGLWVFYGQLITSNRRKHGVLYNIARSLT